jgi:hypothetical protein
MEIMNGLVPETVRPGDYRFRLTEKNVKNQLIFRVAEHVDESFAADFVSYLSLINDKKLDGYNTVTFYLHEYNTRINVVTSCLTGHLIFEVETLKQGPPTDVIKKEKWYSRFLPR